MKSQYRPLIQQVAAQFDLSATLLEAQVFQESSDQTWALHFDLDFFRAYIEHNPRAAAYRYGTFAAVSLGLLQIELEVACERGFTGPPWGLFDPDTGLYWGARYLASLRDLAKGDMHAALRAYNAGPAAITRPEDDVAYATAVLQRESELDG
ncbi:MAG TPA: transglycosylase SLT domain-containing protein [Thermomicrobiaceae bacterium]|nr:transglycosylase SLT domain-containing protein [Thermomicrobiaceae bacterium]